LINDNLTIINSMWNLYC